MAHNSDNIDDTPSIVPERDEVASHRNRKRGNSTTAAPHVQEVMVSETSGLVTFFLVILFLGLCASGAAGYYFYKDSEVSKTGMERALARITQLESRLNLVDEAADQSSRGLLERVDFNFSEIDKLWAARNTLKAEATELKTALAAVQESSKAYEKAIASQATILNENRNLITSIQTRVEQINKNFAGMDNLGGQLTILNADLNKVKTAMDTVQSDVKSRLNATEQDIESINIYRLQVNQTISALQESVNRLQQRVGP